jgi:hypothetical protein
MHYQPTVWVCRRYVLSHQYSGAIIWLNSNMKLKQAVPNHYHYRLQVALPQIVRNNLQMSSSREVNDLINETDELKSTYADCDVSRSAIMSVLSFL